MQTKLTLRLDAHLIAQAKARAQRQGKSLSQVVADYFAQFTSTTTPNALASGIMDAVCGAIILMHGRLQHKVGVGKPVDLIITGGGAAKVAQALPPQFSLDNRVEIVDNLVIYGLLNWVEHT